MAAFSRISNLRSPSTQACDLRRALAALILAAAPCGEAFAADAVSALEFGADPTGAKDSVQAINAALESGADVLVPAGSYTLTAGWISMTKPGQTLRCEAGATMRVVRPGRNATPALIVMPSAVGARVEGCAIDHDGGQFLPVRPFYPLEWDDAISYAPGVGLRNNPKNKSKSNAGIGVAVLVMADKAELRGMNVTRGWDNDIMVARYRLDAPGQSLGPYGVRIVDTRTSLAGSGAHSWEPNFFMGCGIDVGTGVDAVLQNNVDENSRIGFCVDEGGGASAHIIDSVSRHARMTKEPFVKANRMSSYYPAFGDPWHGSTISGSGFFFGGSTLSPINGQPMKDYKASVCTNCQAIEPEGVGVWLGRYSNGARFEGLKVVRPGLEAIWALGGTHSFKDTTLQQPNALKGSTGVWGRNYPWPQTPAIRAICANCLPYLRRQDAPRLNLSREQVQTTLDFRGLTVSPGPRGPSYSYTFSTRSASQTDFATIRAEGGSIAPGAKGLQSLEGSAGGAE